VKNTESTGKKPEGPASNRQEKGLPAGRPFSCREWERMVETSCGKVSIDRKVSYLINGI